MVQAEQQQADLARLRAREAELVASRNAPEDKMRNVGVLPGDTLAKFEGRSHDALQKALKKANKALSKFDKVTLKASEQLGSFQDEELRLQARRKVRQLAPALPLPAELALSA